MKNISVGNREWQLNFDGVDGLDVCPLYQRSDGGPAFLVRVRKGTRIPMHRHHGLEENYLVTGKMEMDGKVMTTGDFLLMEKGEQHTMIALEDSLIYASMEKGFEFVRDGNHHGSTSNVIEISWGQGKTIRFSQVEQLIDFLKKAA